MGLCVALIVGGGRRRLLGVALAGFVVWAVWSLYKIGAGCAPGWECLFSVLIGGIAVLGWLLGVLLAALVVRDGFVGRRTSALVAGIVLLATTAFVYERYGFDVAMWGCPTRGELNRTQSVEEVADAFEDHNLPLEAIPFPVWLPRDEPANRGARVFRYATLDATAYVIVCRGECSISRPRFAEEREIGEQRWYTAITPGNNIAILVTEAGRGDGSWLLETLSPARGEVQPSSRCYIQ